MKKKNNVLKAVFLCYILAAAYLIYFSLAHGLKLGVGRYSLENYSNPYFYTRAAIVIIATAIVLGIYFFVMSKITIHCPHCSRIMETRKVKFTLPKGFLCEQTCPNCGKKFTPDDK